MMSKPSPQESALSAYNHNEHYEDSLFQLLEYLASVDNDLSEAATTKMNICDLIREQSNSEISEVEMSELYQRLVVADGLLARMQTALLSFEQGDHLNCLRLFFATMNSYTITQLAEKAIQCEETSAVTAETSHFLGEIRGSAQLPFLDACMKYFIKYASKELVNNMLLYLYEQCSDTSIDSLPGECFTSPSSGKAIGNLATILSNHVPNEGLSSTDELPVDSTNLLTVVIETHENESKIGTEATITRVTNDYITFHPLTKHTDLDNYFSELGHEPQYIKTFLKHANDASSKPALINMFFNLIFQSRAQEFLTFILPEGLNRIQESGLFIAYLRGRLLEAISDQSIKDAFEKALRQLEFSLILGSNSPNELIHALARKEIRLNKNNVPEVIHHEDSIFNSLPTKLQHYLMLSEQRELNKENLYDFLHLVIKEDYNKLCALDREIPKMELELTRFQQEFVRIPGISEEDGRSTALTRFNHEVSQLSSKKAAITSAKSKLKSLIANLENDKASNWNLLSRAFSVRKEYVPRLCEIKIGAENATAYFKEAEDKQLREQYPRLYALSKRLASFAKKISSFFTSNRVAPAPTINSRSTSQFLQGSTHGERHSNAESVGNVPNLNVDGRPTQAGIISCE